MNIKRSITFSLEKRKKKWVLIVENVPIRMTVRFLGQRAELNTGHRIDVAKWDPDKQRVKNSCTNKQKVSAAEINADLTMFEGEVQQLFRTYEFNEIKPTPEQIRAAFNARFFPTDDPKEDEKKPELPEPPKVLGFFDVYDLFCEQSSKLNNWTDSCRKRYKVVRNHLLAFNEDLTFESLDEDGLNSYADFLQSEYDLRNSTLSKHISLLKTFLRWATRKGYNDNRVFETYRPKIRNIPKKVIFLTKEEIEKLKAYEIPKTKQYLERVRDVFLFCCFSGMRYSDVYNLRRCDIKDDKIVFTTVKTSDPIEVNLNKYSKEILDKYKDIPFKDDKALPVISNQKMNDYIKELAELAEINEQIRISYFKGNLRIDEFVPKYSLMTSHTGRKTFVCLALALGIPPNVVMKWTGHNDYKAMKPYIDIADQIKADMMKRFDEL